MTRRSEARRLRELRPVPGTSTPRRRRLCSRTLAAAALGLVLATACKSVETQPFAEFAKSAQALRDGADKALAANAATASTRFVQRALVAEGAEYRDVLRQLELTVEEDQPLNWGTENLPLFLKAEGFHDAANQANAAFVDYANLLVRLASPELVPAATFDALQEDLNANARDAITRATGAAPDDQDLALFSTLAVKLTREYIESHRREKLVEALRENQPAVAAFAAHLQEGVNLAAAHAMQEYTEAAKTQLDLLAPKPGTGSGSPAIVLPTKSAREPAIAALIALDRKYVAFLATLRALDGAYGQLPAAHAALVKAAESPKGGLESVIALAEEGKRLESIYDKSLAVNRARTARAAATAAQARADALQAQVESAEARAADLDGRAKRAKAEADAAPGDAAKADKSATLRERADAARDRVETLKTLQASAEAAATEAEKAAIELERAVPGAS